MKKLEGPIESPSPFATRAIVATKAGIAVSTASALAGLAYAAAKPTRGGEDYTHLIAMMETIGFVLWLLLASSVFAISLMALRFLFWRKLNRSDFLWMILGLFAPGLVLLLVLLNAS